MSSSFNRQARYALATAIGAGTLVAAPSLAQADQGWLTAGFLASAVEGTDPAGGLGGELSYMHYFGNDTVVESNGLGAFVQMQSYNGDHGRYAWGLQAGGLLGLELGAAYRAPSVDYGDTWGAHLALYGSLGIVSLGLRGVIPVVNNDGGRTGEGHGGEIGLQFGIKVPIPIIGEADIFDLNIPSGRPIRDHHGDVVEVAIEHCDVSDHLRRRWAQMPQPEPETAAQLAALWQQDLAQESAAVSAFRALADDVEALGRGETRALATACRRAAMEEATHVKICARLASRFTGRGCFAPKVQPRRSARLDWPELAVHSFVDGAIGEGIAARAAFLGALRCRDLESRAALMRIAQDEARHAELGWRLIAHALRVDDRRVRSALDALAYDTSQVVTAQVAGEAMTRQTNRCPLRDWGRLGPNESAALASHARAKATATLRAALSPRTRGGSAGMPAMKAA